MRRRLRTTAEIDDFIDRTKQQAEIHAPEVARTIARLSSTWRARLDLSRDRVDVYEPRGGAAAACWLRIDGQRYVLSFDATGVIYLRAGSIRSRPLRQFSDSSFGRPTPRWMGLD